MKFTSFIAVVAAAFMVTAAPVTELEDRATCKTIATGYLSANVTAIHTLKSFTTASDGKLIYTGSGKKPLKVAFQRCPGPYGDDPENGEYSGRVYVPTEDKCIHITNQSSGAPPYYPVVKKCAGGPAEVFVYRTNERKAIYWSGKTDVEGTDPQGGCGLFGYQSHDKGVPTTVSGSHQVKLQCYGHSTPFYLSPKSH